MGADVVVYDRHTEQLLSKELGEYDVIVNALLWDTKRTDHIIYREDLKRMKKGAMIIDVSCDRAGAIETSVPTTLENPTYVVDGITHYVVDHTPSLFYKTTSKCISEVVC
jgi:N5-(carboxyethyl)ornithine synthase